MLTRTDGIEYAQRFVNRLISKGIKIEHAKLFGSYSKNLQSEFSDIDVLLVGKDFTGVGFIDNKMMAEELFEFEIVQVKTYCLEDYNEGNPFWDEIISSGIDLKVN